MVSGTKIDIPYLVVKPLLRNSEVRSKSDSILPLVAVCFEWIYRGNPTLVRSVITTTKYPLPEKKYFIVPPQFHD